MPLRTVFYLRKSTKDKDEKQIHSIPRQRRDIMEFVEKYNQLFPHEQLSFNSENDIVTEDASAKIVGGRPKFNAMIERIKKHKYDVLFCTELSRLSRNAVDAGTLVQLLEDGYLQKIQTKDQRFTATPTDKFVLSLFLSVAKFENDQRALNTKSGMANQKSRGETTHKAPLGYINVGEKKGRRWVERDRQAWEGVRRLWELFLTGDYTIADIHREALAMGVTYESKRGRKAPTESTYRTMFQNRYYLGQIKTTGEEEITWIKGKHPAMVTEQEFDQAQLLMQKRYYRHQKITRTPSIEAILNEILLCGKCKTVVNGLEKHTKMVYEGKSRCTCGKCKHRFPKGDRKECPSCHEAITERTKVDFHRYYRCCKKRSSDACQHNFYGTGARKNVKAEDVEKFLDEEISKLYISDSLFEVLRRQLYTLWLQSNKDLATQIELLETRKGGVIQDRREMRRKALQGSPQSETEKEDADFLIEDARHQELDLDQQIADLREREEEQFEKAWQTLQALREAKSVLGDPFMGIEPKRRLVLSMVSNLTILDDQWTINWKEPFAVIANAGIVKKGRPKSSIVSGGDEFKWLRTLYQARTEIKETWQRLEAAFSLLHRATV